jgi:hypothetical protein
MAEASMPAVTKAAMGAQTLVELSFTPCLRRND